MTTNISVRLFNYFKTTLYKYITTLFLQKYLFCRRETHVYLCRDQDSNLGCLGHNEKYWPLDDHGHCISCFASAMTTIISIRLFNYFKTTLYKYITTFIFAKVAALPHQSLIFISAVTRIRTWVVSATTRITNHYTITAIASAVLHQPWQQSSVLDFSIILRQLYINI